MGCAFTIPCPPPSDTRLRASLLFRPHRRRRPRLPRQGEHNYSQSPAATSILIVMAHCRLAFMLSVLAVAAISLPAAGWDGLGHQIVCLIADTRGAWRHVREGICIMSDALRPTSFDSYVGQPAVVS